MKKSSMVIRAIAYTFLGLYIIFAREHALSSLHLVIGIVIFLESLEEFVVELIRKSFKEQRHSLYHPFAFMILAVIIIFTRSDSIGYLCIMWGIIAIIDSCKELNEVIHEGIRGKAILKLLRSLVAIVFAILLVIDPFEHVHFHMILLAIEYFLESVLMLDMIFLE